jgi:hypothetical protein
MGTSTDAILFYGMTADEEGSFESLVQMGRFDGCGDIDGVIARLAGFDTPYATFEDYAAYKAAKLAAIAASPEAVRLQSLGVKYADHGADSYRIPYLYVQEVTASRGSPVEVALWNLDLDQPCDGADARLQEAVAILTEGTEYPPTWSDVGWHLVSWGG